jgi:rsbT co-antagonist protein RsbR
MTDTDVPDLSGRIAALLRALSSASVGEFLVAKAALSAPIEDEFGELECVIGIFLGELHDARVSNEKAMAALEASRDELRRQIETTERQRIAIRDLSTPIIDLWEGIITLPIVGTIDTQRAREIAESLLEAIVARSAAYVIIDVTGVAMIDTKTADYLIRMTRSAELLGSHCVVTGIGPEIARTLAEIGVELGNVRTLRTLREGLKDGLLHLREQRTASVFG